MNPRIFRGVNPSAGPELGERPLTTGGSHTYAWDRRKIETETETEIETEIERGYSERVRQRV